MRPSRSPICNLRAVFSMNVTTQITIQYSRAKLGEMEECARRAKPYESCALLFGTKFPAPNPSKTSTQVVYSVERVDCIPSSRLSEVSFVIEDYETFLERWKAADALGLKLVGVYHSHPAPAAPSGTDKQNMRWMDESNFKFAVWVIQSMLKNHATNAFIYTQNQFFKVPIQIIE